jgi:hypothetical protein
VTRPFVNYIHECDWEPREYEALVRCGDCASIGYGETPLQAARRAWRYAKQAAVNDLTQELRKQ